MANLVVCECRSNFSVELLIKLMTSDVLTNNRFAFY